MLDDAAIQLFEVGQVDAALPGRIEFESSPEVLRAGDSYSLRILLDNRGMAPIGIREVIVTATVNGKPFSVARTG